MPEHPLCWSMPEHHLHSTSGLPMNKTATNSLLIVRCYLAGTLFISSCTVRKETYYRLRRKNMRNSKKKKNYLLVLLLYLYKLERDGIFYFGVIARNNSAHKAPTVSTAGFLLCQEIIVFKNNEAT